METQQRIRQYLGYERKTPIMIKYSLIPKDERPFQYCYTEFINKPFPSKKTTYYQDMTRCLHYMPHLYKTTFLFYPHDRVEGFSVPTLVKSRPIHDYEESILFNLNYLRHFADVYKVEDLDIPYDQKRGVLVWRGADTGYGFGNDIPYRPVSRQTLVETYGASKDPILDIGLSSVSVNQQPTTPHRFDKFLKPKVKIQELLAYKFLLSVEGNDVATNLKWILYSNSVAFCPPFTMNSWILEENLQPWHHYVPVRHDFHDLPDKVEWALNHPEQCQSISKNATQYMEQFLDLDNENIIMQAVLDQYSKNIKIME